jgi:hypothetical protein
MSPCIIDNNLACLRIRNVKKPITTSDFVFPSPFIDFALKWKHSPWKASHRLIAKVLIATQSTLWRFKKIC